MAKHEKDYRRRKVGDHELHPETQMMGYGYDPLLSEGALKVPVFQTSTFVFKTAQEGKDFFALAYGQRQRGPAEDPGLIYSRINNPDLEVLEDRLTLWEGAEQALVFNSGMAAISTTLWTHLKPGDVMVHSEPMYGGTEFLVRNILPKFGIKSAGFIAGSSPGEIAAVIEDAKSLGDIGAIYVETPANPTNGLVDIAACAEASHSLAKEQATRPPVIVDNTFLGPIWQHPLKLGADIVVYSLTKYVGGHSDVVAGGCLGSKEFIDPVRGMRTILGTMADPYTGWLLMRSLETVKLRMTCSMKNARQVAEYLADHPKVKTVHYLGFIEEGHPQFELYRSQCMSPGSTFSFEIHGGEAEAFRLLDSLQVIKLAVSLGGTESLMEHPATMTHSDVPVQTQERLGLTPALVRISIGIENAEDIIADLAQALEEI